MEAAKVASRQSRSNESNTASKQKVNQRQNNIGPAAKSQNTKLAGDSAEREPQVPDLGNGPQSIDMRGGSAHKKGSQDKKKVLSQDVTQNLQMVSSADGYDITSNTNGEEVNFQMSNKSELNIVAQSSNHSGSANTQQPSFIQQSTTGKKKRKTSDKAQRRTSNNRKEKEEKQMLFPPAEQNGSNPRSQSRGTVSQQSQGNMGQKEPSQPNMQQHLPSYYDAANFNPFAQNPQVFMGNQPGFPFGQANSFGNQQPPQVHFIAKKQQFIAQISPEQLMSGDKRPYTTQSLHTLSANAKRAGSVYANAMHSAAKNSGNYNLANAAFAGHPQVYLNAGNRTHTQGFSFHPPGQHKYTNSMYGDEVKPKIAGKDILQALGSGYSTDPYNSVMSQGGLPIPLTHPNRPVKAKASQNRLQAKEKEQLYEETIKMKVLNNQIKEDNVKLKTKVKILENELSRKEKTIEDLFSHNQLIAQNAKHQTNSNQSLLPLAQTAQKYQQETFLVMSLKKQIRELKYEVVKRDEELEILRKNIKCTKTKEFEQEIQTYSEECQRLRDITEELMKQGANHPIHQQNFDLRLKQMQGELQHKDMMIQQLSESLQNHIQMEKNYNQPLAQVKVESSQHVDSTPSDVNANVSREKSVEKNKPAKDINKELQKAKKSLREKEKELQKIKQEFGQIKKENQEKQKTESQQTKDVEQNFKFLKDKMKEAKVELKKKDEKIIESDVKIKKLEEQMKECLEKVKTYDETNKQLKAEIRKHRAAKKESLSAAEPKNEVLVTEPSPIRESRDPETVEKLEKIDKIEKSEKVEKVEEKKVQKSERPKAKPPLKEIALIVLIAQREKLCRDDLTSMMLAGEESLKMLIKNPSDQLIDFIKENLHDEDAILATIPRFEMPKTDFETQVLREMRIVLRDNAENIQKKVKDELMNWDEFKSIYSHLDNFEYPHKDKLLEFIKYFFLDHIVNEKEILINAQAFCDHLMAKKPLVHSSGKTRNESGLRSRRKSGESEQSFGASDDNIKRRMMAGSDDERYNEEERMLDIAEQCFMRIADLLHMQQKTVKQVFLKYSIPEKFKDGSVLELLTPRAFLEGVRDTGFDDVTEMEAACLMKVLAKPELENAIILNEFVLIMENFGIPPITEEEEFENDYQPDSDAETIASPNQSKPKADNKELAELDEKLKKFGESKKIKNPLQIKFSLLDEKGTKIMKKLARFLLERYMHPREFFGPTIKKDEIGKKKSKVEVIKSSDFYLRLKLASIRKKLKQNDSLNQFLAIDGDKFPGLVHVKKMIKALEAIAEGEQEIMLKEQEEKEAKEREEIIKELQARKEKGLPELSVEEILAQKKKEKLEDVEKKKKKEKELSEAAEGKKPPKGPPGAIEKIGGKSPKNKLASHLGPNVQLNTIEEDLHETQTSHYSYQINEGHGSEREGSKHQLSTSNHLRDSNNQGDPDTSRRSKNGLPIGASVGSNGDYSGGSQSGSKKKMRDIGESNVTIKEFQQIERTRSEMGNNKSERIHMPNSLIESVASAKLELAPAEQLKTQKLEPEKAVLAASAEYSEEEEDYEEMPDKIESLINNLDLEDAELEQKLKDELDEEVDKKFKTQIRAEEQEEYDEDESQHNDPDYLREDTIKTDKIEQIIENEKRFQDDEYSYHEEETPKNGEGKKPESDYEEDYEF